jgi:hypothetical protein
MKPIKEANDSWDGMLTVRNNKASIPKIDLGTLYSEEEMFRVYDITMPKSLEILGNILMSGLIEHRNFVSPTSAIHQVRLMFNRAGYDFEVTQDRINTLATMKEEGFVDFPLVSVLQEKLGYSLVVRIHSKPVTINTNEIEISTQYYDGEIVPQDV